MYHEVNFDGLVGPTHNYAGLSPGNRASIENRAAVSSPRTAALQGLDKMAFLARLGVRQAILPPLARPKISALRDLGFTGTDKSVVQQAADQAPELLAACFSASSMWAANAATMAPSCDTGDSKTHFTPANLITNFHRSLEARDTADLLKTIFADPDRFTHHPPLPAALMFSDEGAANHIRFASFYGMAGLHLLVYGRNGGEAPSRYPRRQTLAACQAIARNHQIPGDRVIFAKQHPAAIDAGAFHNDVISAGNLNLFLYHASAFADSDQIIPELERAYRAQCGDDLIHHKIADFTLEEAVKSYFFNSQIVTDRNGKMVLIAPEESRQSSQVFETIQALIADKNCPLIRAEFLNLRESMRNGGGPACLRNRVVLSDQEIESLPQTVFLTDTIYQQLKHWIEEHYRESLAPPDLLDLHLINEVRTALDQLTQILKLGSIYDFQKA
jgi:succinylarginine dihydrolase